jgi:solute carrier family 25 oxoglutarate transporter 11
VAGGGDVACRLAAWQYFYGGTNSPSDYSDWNTFKYFGCALLSSTVTLANTVPFEMARRAYYADRTWPQELRRGYTSPLNALLRIPVEEGLGYLFKGSMPIVASSFAFWMGVTTMYSYMKNHTYFMWVYNDFNYNFIKTLNLSASFFIASIVSYPFYFTREMVDIWPKERGGHCTWNNSYRACMKWMLENVDMMYYNFLSGYTRWVARFGLGYFISLWVADNLGMFSNCNENFNSLEQIFPIAAESI